MGDYELGRPVVNLNSTLNPDLDQISTLTFLALLGKGLFFKGWK
jgi:hypothetical protein